MDKSKQDSLKEVPRYIAKIGSVSGSVKKKKS